MAPPRRRSARQRKLKEIVDTEGDKDFWTQEALVDADSDAEFDLNATSDEGEDIVDSDFDNPEEAEEDTEAAERDALDSERLERRKRRSTKYKDPALKRNRGPVRRQTRSTPPKKKARKVDGPRSSPDSATEKRGLRKSTRVRSERAAKEREKKLAEEEDRKKERSEREKRKPKVKILTQQEMLEEAKETEIKNREDLEILLRLEEERKRLPPPKKKNVGPRIVIKSSGGISTVSFTKSDIDVQSFMFPRYSPERSVAKPAVCVVTGQPAKYKDPKTGLPYANAAAFKRIQESSNPQKEFSVLPKAFPDRSASQNLKMASPDGDVQTQNTAQVK